jgi:cyanophycin synthetase
VLEALGEIDEPLLCGWRTRVERAAARLGWDTTQTIVRRHAGAASLAITAAVDQLFLATEINEWALCATLVERNPERRRSLEDALAAVALDALEEGATPGPDDLPVLDDCAALERFVRLAAAEARPKLRALLGAAGLRDLPYVLDETELTVGAGAGGRSYPLSVLPDPAELPWDQLTDIPTAIVTGSNGKTTTVRLLAACARAHGWHVGFNCTDGVFLDDESLATGDYSGPAGARRVLRERRAQAAILETARGGILRRGIAVSRARAAVVTNVSADHFGEYGIDDLTALADVKLAVAGIVSPSGLLVLNADDAQLRSRVDGLVGRFGRCPAVGWFAQDADHALLREARSRGAPTCGVRAERLCLTYEGRDHDLGRIDALPLSVDGIAAYNIANMAAAALGAAALGVPATTIARVFARFGARVQDNPGRLMRFERNGVRILIDYAHNPDGLRGFLRVAEHLRGTNGRLGLLLGHAGNRNDADIEE